MCAKINSFIAFVLDHMQQPPVRLEQDFFYSLIQLQNSPEKGCIVIHCYLVTWIKL